MISHYDGPHDSYSNFWDGEENTFYSADSVMSCDSDELKKEILSK